MPRQRPVLETIRTGLHSESILPGVERMNGRMIANEQAAVNNWKYFAESTASFHYYMADALLSAAERRDHCTNRAQLSRAAQPHVPVRSIS